MVEAVPAQTSDQIKEICIGLAEKHLAAKDSYKVLKDEADKSIWQGKEEGVPCTVGVFEAEGLTMEDFREFYNRDNWCANMKLLDKNITAEILDVDMGEGMAMYQHIKTPMVVSNRCVFSANFCIDLEGGGMIQISTSKGMEKIIEQSAAKIGKDVLSNTIFSYIKFEPKATGGVTITAIICVDPAGSIPDFVKDKIAAANSDTTIKMIAHLRKKKGLK